LRGGQGTKPFCFVVDDEEGIRLFVSKAMDHLGIQTRGFRDARSALSGVEQCAPDIIFLDVSLERSDAIEVMRGLGDRRYSGKVQLMSGRDAAFLDDVRKIGERHGLKMLPVLHKPFRIQAIRSIALEQDLLGTAISNQSPREISSDVAFMPAITLDQAFKENWLEVWYQPKINLSDMRLVGAEALIRTRHPQFGIVPPSVFLADASEASLLTLSEYVLLTAMRDWQAFADAGAALRLAINIPVSSLVKLSFPSLVREHRPKDDAWPGLILEVTEGEIVRDIALAHEIATQLRIYDIQVAIDDFGVGYSSLARLRDLPFAELKLDRSFVKNCAGDETNAALCSTIIDLAHRFGTIAVAEGIEQPADLRALHQMGCDLGQGFLFAPPMPKDRFTALLYRQEGL